MDYIIEFGKHKGKSMQEVKDKDPAYLEWIFKKDDLNPHSAMGVVHKILVENNFSPNLKNIKKSTKTKKQPKQNTQVYFDD